jgi:hypothetical protein
MTLPTALASLTLTVLSWDPYLAPADSLEVVAAVVRPVWTTCETDRGPVPCPERYDVTASLREQLPTSSTSIEFDHPPLEPSGILYFRVFTIRGECVSP